MNNRLVYEWVHADTCLPDYWGGHHRPHVSIAVWNGMTLSQIKDAIRSELREGAVAGNDEDAVALSADLVADEAYADRVTKAAYAAVNRIKPNKRGQRRFFMDLEAQDEDADYSVYAYFVLMPLERL